MGALKVKAREVRPLQVIDQALEKKISQQQAAEGAGFEPATDAAADETSRALCSGDGASRRLADCRQDRQ